MLVSMRTRRREPGLAGRVGRAHAKVGPARLLGAVLAAALALFFCVGHLSHVSMGMGAPDELVHGVGVCLLAAMLLAGPVLPARPAYRVRLPLSSPAPPSFALVAPAVPAAPARASPAWLQRFRD